MSTPVNPQNIPLLKKWEGGRNQLGWQNIHPCMKKYSIKKKIPDGGVIVVVIRIFELLLEPQVKLPEKKKEQVQFMSERINIAGHKNKLKAKPTIRLQVICAGLPQIKRNIKHLKLNKPLANPQMQLCYLMLIYVFDVPFK